MFPDQAEHTAELAASRKLISMRRFLFQHSVHLLIIKNKRPDRAGLISPVAVGSTCTLTLTCTFFVHKVVQQQQALRKTEKNSFVLSQYLEICSL